MAKEFRLPDIGEGLTEAEIVRWLVAVGEPVETDQPVVEVETDKAVVELPSPYGGVVLAHGGAEGTVVPVGEVLVVVGEPGEIWPVADAAPRSEPLPIVGTLSEEAVDLTPAPSPARSSLLPEPIPIRSGPPGIQALPLVRKLAREQGVDLARIRGSGPAGRILREDVVTAVGTRGQAGEDDERRPLSRLRRTIAANMARSWAEIPHVTTFDEVDATRLLAARRALQDRHGDRIPVDALVAKAVLPVLTAFPEFNATFETEHLVLHRRHHLGVAVDTPEGLLVAVIQDAGSHRLLGLAGELGRLAAAAKDRRLTPAELTGQTFTISNIGAVGGGFGTPIIPSGTTAILSVGRAIDRPVARDGRIEIASLLPLSLSYDHRVIDGGSGRRFMAMLIENLEEPALFLVDA